MLGRFTHMKTQNAEPAFAKRMSFVVLFLSLPLFYVLSIGPAMRLLQARVLPEEFVGIYEPLRPLCDPNKPMGRALIRYQSWWIGHKSASQVSPVCALDKIEFRHW